MADEWDDDYTTPAKPMVTAAKYSKPVNDDDWETEPSSSATASKSTGWSGGGGGGGAAKSNDDWSGGASKSNDNGGWSGGSKSNENGGGGGGGWGGGGGRQQNGGGGGGGGRPRAADWLCSSCQGKNFGSRTSCFKCQEPKSDDAEECEVTFQPKRDQSGGRGDSRPKRGGEWDCSCGANNFASRTECFKCKEPKPEGAGGGGGNDGGGWGGSSEQNGGSRPPREPRAGDWDCSCGVNNFASRNECFKCKEPKPEGAGGGAPQDRAGFREDAPKEFYIPAERNEEEIFNAGISSGINFEKYDNIPVKVTGENRPNPITSFDDSGLESFLIDNVKRAKYTKPTPIQKNAIPIVLKKRDLMACAQTGSGKTAAFLLPIINTLLTENKSMSVGKPHVVIMSPTRELAIQIYDEARKFAAGSIIKTCVIYGGTATRHQSSNVNRGCHILVATPGRLKDFVDKTYITFDDIRFVVLDEADRMLDLGFMTAVEQIMDNPTMTPVANRQTLMFSATFPEDIQRLAGKFLNNYLFITVGIVGGACADVEQSIFEVTKFEKRGKLSEVLDAEDPVGTIVFVETKRNADFLASYLSESKHPTTSIHGDRLQRQREEALSDFKSGRMKILIATSVAARGLDIPNVRHVINYELPKGIDDYVHRIGRTGRVGNRGKATSFYDAEQDSALSGDLVRILEQANQQVPDFLKGSGGGGGGFGQKGFGGSDFRNEQNHAAVPQQHGGDEEEW